MRRTLTIVLTLFITSLAASAVDKPGIVMDWPATSPHTIHLEFGKFVRVGSYGKQNSYTLQVTAQNVSNKTITLQSLEIYVFDKDKVRIGEAYFDIRDLSAGQKTIQPLSFTTTGTPTSMELRAAGNRLLATVAGEISLLVNTTPSGAELKLDGKVIGTSPKNLRVSVGHHDLEVSHAGYRTAQYPIEADPTLNGGRIDLELGTAAQDTLELRDGSIVVGDLIKVDTDNITIQVAGQDQVIARNRVNRILLVPRLPVSQ